jgi:hypothetical protein
MCGELDFFPCHYSLNNTVQQLFTQYSCFVKHYKWSSNNLKFREDINSLYANATSFYTVTELLQIWVSTHLWGDWEMTNTITNRRMESVNKNG